MHEQTLYLNIDRINSIITDFCTQEKLTPISENEAESAVDIRVFNLMENLYSGNKVVSQTLKDQPVYDLIRSKTKKGNKGRSDITLFNYFGNSGIDILIENKFDKTKGNPICEAINYCNDINHSGKFTCRVAIGFNQYDNCQIITKVLSKDGNWEDLIINEKKINGFIGQEILRLIYSYPGITKFNLVLKDEKKFKRSEFKLILESDLPKIFRNISDIASNNSLKISFTVAFISLKIILEKQESLENKITDEGGKLVYWRNNNDKIDNKINSLRNVSDIKNAVNAIVGETAAHELKEKYQYIFQLQDNLTFNDLIDKIRATETKNKIRQEDSSINEIKGTLDKIKNQSSYHFDFDLFGEVYEALADSKTKETLGQYFTKRHIIRPIINITFKPSDLEGIINENKTICDPFCGTGGMLTETFRHIKAYCNEKYPQKNTSEIANKVIYGYDIIDLNVSKTKINMTLADDGYSTIDSRDSLATLKKENVYDYIITNVPYGTGYKNGIVKNLNEIVTTENNNDDRTIMVNRVKNFEKNNNIKKLEYNSFIKVVQLLKEGGKAVVIIPDGLLENPSFSKMREWFLVKCKIDNIISLPKSAFSPYTKEKTYAITFTKRKRIDTEELVECITDIDNDEKFYSYIIDNDGYANSDKQYETNLKDENGKPLHNELSDYYDIHGNYNISIIEQVFKIKNEDNEKHCDEWNNEIKGKKYGYIYVRDILKDYYYDSENENISNRIYRINLLPEKYLRPKNFENLSLEELRKFRLEIENELKLLFGGIKID